MNAAIIVGAGAVGSLTALALAKRGWQVTVIEKLACSGTELPASYDDRQLALSHSSATWLNDTLLPNLIAKMTPILRIHTSAQQGFGVMLMDHCEQDVPALGYTISLTQLGEMLFTAMTQQTNITLVDQVDLSHLTQDMQQVSLQGSRLGMNLSWQADYLFAADGADSWVRHQLGIGHRRHDYAHRLMTAVATLAAPHQHLAIERFTPQGPTALLPMLGTHQAKLVFSYPLAEKAEIEGSDLNRLTQLANHQLGKQLGNLVGIHHPRHYAAADILPDHIIDQRCLLIGNAAHTQHPVAGQGLNLGIRDVMGLADWAIEPSLAGLSALAQMRLQDHQRTTRLTAGLNQLFTHPSQLVRQASSVGIALLQACSPIKKMITRVAMG